MVASDVAAVDGYDAERSGAVTPDDVVAGGEPGVDGRVLDVAAGPAFTDLRVRAPGGRDAVRADLNLAAVQISGRMEDQGADIVPDVENHAAGAGWARDMFGHRDVPAFRK